MRVCKQLKKVQVCVCVCVYPRYIHCNTGLYVYIIAGIFVLVSADDAGSATGVSFAVALFLGVVNG